MPAGGKALGTAVRYLDYGPLVVWLLQQRVHHCQAVDSVKSPNFTWLSYEGHRNVASLLIRLRQEHHHLKMDPHSEVVSYLGADRGSAPCDMASLQ